ARLTIDVLSSCPVSSKASPVKHFESQISHELNGFNGLNSLNPFNSWLIPIVFAGWRLPNWWNPRARPARKTVLNSETASRKDSRITPPCRSTRQEGVEPRWGSGSAETPAQNQTEFCAEGRARN